LIASGKLPSDFTATNGLELSRARRLVLEDSPLSLGSPVHLSPLSRVSSLESLGTQVDFGELSPPVSPLSLGSPVSLGGRESPGLAPAQEVSVQYATSWRELWGEHVPAPESVVHYKGYSLSKAGEVFGDCEDVLQQLHLWIESGKLPADFTAVWDGDPPARPAVVGSGVGEWFPHDMSTIFTRCLPEMLAAFPAARAVGFAVADNTYAEFGAGYDAWNAAGALTAWQRAVAVYAEEYPTVSWKDRVAIIGVTTAEAAAVTKDGAEAMSRDSEAWSMNDAAVEVGVAQVMKLEPWEILAAYALLETKALCVITLGFGGQSKTEAVRFSTAPGFPGINVVAWHAAEASRKVGGAMAQSKFLGQVMSEHEVLEIQRGPHGKAFSAMITPTMIELA
jgi:hypothetical protein